VSKSFVISQVLAATLGALALDGLTKTSALQALDLYQPVPIMGQFFRLTLNYTSGVAFGLFASDGVLPTILTGSIISGLCAWLARSVHRQAAGFEREAYWVAPWSRDSIHIARIPI
jgi:lipoprotein signal peptidase